MYDQLITAGRETMEVRSGIIEENCEQGNIERWKGIKNHEYLLCTDGRIDAVPVPTGAS